MLIIINYDGERESKTLIKFSKFWNCHKIQNPLQRAEDDDGELVFVYLYIGVYMCISIYVYLHICIFVFPDDRG